jgi:hypothetical protein
MAMAVNAEPGWTCGPVLTDEPADCGPVCASVILDNRRTSATLLCVCVVRGRLCDVTGVIGVTVHVSCTPREELNIDFSIF